MMRGQEVWQSALSILCFYPCHEEEPDILPLIEDVWRAKKQLTLPRWNSTSATYEAAQISGPSQLARGLFGMLEPDAGCPSIPLNQLDFILVPGVAFDLTGRRLGRGKGFYDRLLAQVRGHKCGVAFDAQIVAEVPEEPHDVRVDSILTPTRWQWCRRAA